MLHGSAQGQKSYVFGRKLNDAHGDITEQQ